MITLAYGTLPTRSFLAPRVAGTGASVDTTLGILRQLLAKGRPHDALALLNSLGFTWRGDALPDADMQEAVDSVEAALRGTT